MLHRADEVDVLAAAWKEERCDLGVCTGMLDRYRQLAGRKVRPDVCGCPGDGRVFSRPRSPRREDPRVFGEPLNRRERHVAALFGNDLRCAADERAIPAQEALDDRDARAALGEYDGVGKDVCAAWDIVGDEDRFVARRIGRHVHERAKSRERGRQRAKLRLGRTGRAESAREERAVLGSGRVQIARDRACVRVFDQNRARIRSERR